MPEPEPHLTGSWRWPRWGGRYRLAAATGVAGCFGFAALDVALILSAIFVLAPVSRVTAVAMAASLTRIAVTARVLRRALAR